MLENFKEIVEGAVLIESHTDRYKNTKREDRTLIQDNILFNAFRVGDTIVPVEINIKERRDSIGQAYVTLTVGEIKAEESVAGNRGDLPHIPRETSDVYSIARIAQIVNSNYGGVLKYFPDSMLSDEQMKAKEAALEKEREKLDKIVQETIELKEKQERQKAEQRRRKEQWLKEKERPPSASCGRR